MNTKEQMEFHEASMIFPMLDDDDLMSLAGDIEKNGQREPCLVSSGKILDGRNRWMACMLKGIKAKVKEIQEPDDPVSFVLSLNLHRRHLTPSQASMCAARAREIYEKQAKERMVAGTKTDPVENLPQGKARDIAGKAFGVSGKSVDHAKRVIEKGIPELVKAVDEGRMAVSTAAILATEPPEVQRSETANPSRNRVYTSQAGGGNPVVKTKVDPMQKHIDTETFALSKADVAITQLKGIPEKNKYREAALERVSKWIARQRNTK